MRQPNRLVRCIALLTLGACIAGTSLQPASAQALTKKLTDRYAFLPVDPKRTDWSEGEKFAIALSAIEEESGGRLEFKRGACVAEFSVIYHRATWPAVVAAAQTHGYKHGLDIRGSVQSPASAQRWCGDNPDLCNQRARLFVDLPAPPPNRADLEPIKVAVIDTGIDKERLGSFFIGNPRTFLTGHPTNPTPPDGRAGAIDDNGHGTHMASNIVTLAGADNDVVRIIPIKSYDADGHGLFFDQAQAVDYAARTTDGGQGADIVNASWGAYPGGSGPQSVAVEALWRCMAKYPNTLFVTAAGNYNNLNQKRFFYPASFSVASSTVLQRLEHVLSVMGVSWHPGEGRDDDVCPLWVGSNYGPNSVDVAAPMTLVQGLYPRNLLRAPDKFGLSCRLSGTSVSAAILSGVMARLFYDHQARARPRDWPQQLRGTLANFEVPLKILKPGEPERFIDNRAKGHLRRPHSPDPTLCHPLNATKAPPLSAHADETCRFLRKP